MAADARGGAGAGHGCGGRGVWVAARGRGLGERRRVWGYVAMSRRSPQGAGRRAEGSRPQLHHSTGYGGGVSG